MFTLRPRNTLSGRSALTVRARTAVASRFSAGHRVGPSPRPERVAAAPAVASQSGKVSCRNAPNFPRFWGDLASRPTPDPSAVVQRDPISSEHVLDFSRASGLVASSRSGARCARTWAPSAVQIATPPPLLFVHGPPGCAGGGRMPVGDSNALATRRQLPGRWDRGDRRRSAHS